MSRDLEDPHEFYWKEDRKAGKHARKIATARDRSKFKKTDREKHQKYDEEAKNKKLAKNEYSKGRVLSIVSQGVIVEEDGNTYVCSLRGVLKKDISQFKNLVTVGDFVLFEKQADQEGAIMHIEPRQSILSRADNLSRRKEQLIAANIDQVLITVATMAPPLKSSIVDRYIIAAHKGNMQPVIVINKIDLLKDPEQDPISQEVENEYFNLFLEAYQQTGIQVIPVSIVTKEGLDLLKEAMKDKASVFSGQSGVGKTSLINAITGNEFRTGKMVEKTSKGAHTTSTTNLMPLTFGGWCIDTPGIKSFGVWDLGLQEIQEYFTEIFECGRNCKFPDCSHLHEDQCAVAKAVEEGLISELRYESYQALMESVSEKHRRR